MYDVEYLMHSPRLARSLVYRYRTGRLIVEMRRAVERALRSTNRELAASHPEEFSNLLYGASLFDQHVPFCDWPRRKSARIARKAAEIVEGLCDEEAVSGVLFAHIDDSIFKQPKWLEAPEACVIIDEPAVSPTTIGRIIDYFFAMSDFQGLPDPRAPVVAFFSAVLERDGEEELDNFERKFDETMLLYVDEATNAFRPPDVAEAVTGGRSYVLRPLRRLVEQEEEDAINELIEGLHLRLRERAMTASAVLGDLCEATQRLITTANERDIARDVKSVESHDNAALRRVLWTSLLLVWSRRLAKVQSIRDETFVPRADPALVIFDQLGRDFLVRASAPVQDGQVSDLWPEIRASLEDFAEGGSERRLSARDRTVLSLASYTKHWNAYSYRPSWVDRLDLMLAPAISRRKVADEEELQEGSAR